MAVTQSIPLGPSVVITQNVTYALPGKACYLSTSSPCDVSIDGTTFAAHTSGQIVNATFIKCTTGNATVLCKSL